MARGDIDRYNATLTPEQRVNNAKRAAAASVDVRRQKGFVRNRLKQLLSDDELDAILYKIMSQARVGDIPSYRAIMDTLGEFAPAEAIVDVGEDTRNAVANMSMAEKLALIKAAQDASK